MGHAGAWDYTPRQAWAFLFFARRRRRRETARDLRVHALGASGDRNTVNEELRKLEDDASPGV